MMYAYQKQSGTEVRVARIFNTFGPRMHPNDGRVVSNFIIQALQGKDLTIYGNGAQTRSFQYVDDLVNGLIKLMNGKYDQPVNIGNPDEYSVLQFAKMVKELVNSNSTIKYLPATQGKLSHLMYAICMCVRVIYLCICFDSSLTFVHLWLHLHIPDDPRQRKPDIRVAKAEIGWQPLISVKDGLRKTVEYFQAEVKAMGEVIPTGPKAERPQKVRDERRLLLKDDEGSSNSVSVSVSDGSDKNTEVGR